jgi:hypothetical protein
MTAHLPGFSADRCLEWPRSRYQLPTNFTMHVDSGVRPALVMRPPTLGFWDEMSSAVCAISCEIKRKGCYPGCFFTGSCGTCEAAAKRCEDSCD